MQPGQNKQYDREGSPQELRAPLQWERFAQIDLEDIVAIVSRATNDQGRVLYSFLLAHQHGDRPATRYFVPADIETLYKVLSDVDNVIREAKTREHVD